MPMPVMHIRIMRVGVENGLVRVPMRVRFARRVGAPMLVLVMQIMGMQMFMILGHMAMTVLMTFREMEPQPDGH